ncbi:MAG: Peptidyl-dipeptidase dcp [Pseudomonadota bacterium]|jgi:peptidyl-dipeptidase Dcp
MNPLLTRWNTPYELPPFEAIEPEHFLPAFEEGLSRHMQEVDAIAEQAEPPTFENTLVALERSGAPLTRVERVFSNLAASHTSPALQSIEREIAPRLAAHHSSIALNAALFARVAALHERKDQLGLDPESARLLERVHLDFVRNGAQLLGEARASFAQRATRLASLYTQFAQNVLADEARFQLVLRTEDELSGLPDFVKQSARQAALERGLEDENVHVITLSRASLTPFMTFSARRDLRQQLWAGWCARGEHAGPTDNRPIILEILELRLQQARALGYPSFADYALADTMAQNPGRVRSLLSRLWRPARERAIAERAAMQALAASEGCTDPIEAHDWHFWAERLRSRDYELDEAELKPYLQLDRLVEAMFYVAGRLFGLRFTARTDLPRYVPSLRTWEVSDQEGRHLGVFMGDNFARSSKRSGAWMSVYRKQNGLLDPGRPIVVNNNNFSQAPEGKPTLLSVDDAHTLFHEFGHGLHGLLSECRYPRLAGTSVLRDFVELPSQIYEHWLLQPEVLQRFAVHVETGEPMPLPLMEKLLRARHFNQGFATVEYLSCAILDLDLHEKTSFQGLDLAAFEMEQLKALDMPEAIGMRHRLPHFQHLFAGASYASAYYVYIWAEVLDADGFDAFVEAGDIFDPETARRLHKEIYSVGNRVDPMQAYLAFRGRAPAVEPLLAQRGLLES